MQGLASTPMNGNGNVTMNMPAGIVAGEQLMCVFSDVSTLTTPVTSSAGWTRSFIQTGPNTYYHLAVFTKIAVGGDTLVIDRGGNTALCAGHVFRVSGSKGFAISAGIQGNGGATVDPPLLTPPWGSKKTLWAALASLRSTNANITSYSAGYSQGANSYWSGLQDPCVSVAFRQLKTASEDPGLITYSASGADFAAVTIGFNPG